MNRRPHPYKDLPDHAFWRRAVAAPPPGEVDPVVGFRLKITPSTKVATAGSCFAQHIARHLRLSGFNYYVVETGHPVVPAAVLEANHYGVFSARYGNLYTARQLRQLFERAYGRFSPEEDIWHEPDGSVLDPFRPSVQPGGFISAAELRADRAQHLAKVRQMFETLDVFVFTLGLTECWQSRRDGAVFPVCPGVAGGTFEPARHEFVNQRAADVVSDLTAFLAGLGSVNPGAQVVLTVSPVPLMATARSDTHVLAATSYSKAALRVAAEETCAAHPDRVHYFPSYEIITGLHARGRYFGDDLRSVREEGVAHVMRLFLLHAAGTGSPAVGAASPAANRDAESHALLSENIIEVECDETSLDP